MASIVLFHSVYGLRPAVLADAERLREAGHKVTTPDLYHGAIFGDVESGMAHKASIGEERLMAGAVAAVESLPPGQVYAGYSLGSGFAQWLLETRRDAAAGLFLSGGDGPQGEWPDIPAQAHAALGDEWVDEPELEKLQALGVEVFRYQGGHLFADPDLPDFNADSAALLWERVLEFLARLD